MPDPSSGLTTFELLTIVATAALVLITAVYAWTTWQLVVEMRITRHEASSPALNLSPELLGPRFPIARLTNLGPGYAVAIEGDIWVEVAGDERWRYSLHLPLMAPGAKHDFTPDLADKTSLDVGALAGEARRFHMNLSCVDAAGRRHVFAGVADWSTYTEHVFGAHLLLEADHEREVRSYLEKIGDQLKSAVDILRASR